MNENKSFNLDKQLKHQEEMKKKARLSNFVAKYAIVIVIASFIIPFFLPSLLGALAFLIFYVGVIPFTIYVLVRRYKQKNADSALRETIVTELIPPILDEFFEDVVYRPNETIPQEQIRETAIWSSADMQYINGNDYIKGKYKGMPIQLCDVEISWSEETRDTEEHIRYIKHTIMKGQWMILETCLRPKSPIHVLENRSKTSRFLHPVQMEHTEFNKRFEVAGDPFDAFAILTPIMMENLLLINTTENESIRICFLPDGRVGIAFDNSTDMLEVSNQKFKNSEELRQKIVDEVERCLCVVDALNLR